MNLVPDGRQSSAMESASVPTTVLLRRLPKDTTAEAVRTMLLFAKDLKDTEIISNEYEEDRGFSTAFALFSSMSGAAEAQTMLDGKPNTAKQANMIVKVITGPSLSLTGRRNTMEPMAGRGAIQPLSPSMSNGQKASRFNGTFQSLEKFSPPTFGSPPDHSSSESSSHLQTIFAPHSPVSNSAHDARVTGKSVIEDGADDETGDLINDPVAYMKNDHPSFGSMSRRPTNSRLPIEGFAALKLNTKMPNSSGTGYASARSTMHAQTPQSAFSPAVGSNGTYNPPGPHFLRHNYPPVNPADQNPPCNTLYVGNLPIDTSEDELKAMFSKQRGYKRLCFRTKQNGPMCFVEFEDVSFATKALNELYGVQLHNSVKGGIRLSFSKNPLGVRSVQPGGQHPSTPMSPGGPMPMAAISAMSPCGYSSTNGPPPGLSVPPGLNMSMPMGAVGSMPAALMNGQYVGPGMGSAMHSMRGMQMSGQQNGQAVGGMYPDYMLGR